MSTPGEKTAADAAARRAGGPRPGWGERAGWALAVVGPLAFLAIFFAWPVATLMGRGLAPDGALDLSGFGEVLARERTWRILTQTLTQAVLGTAVCVALGIPGALVLYRRAFPGRDLLRGVVTVPFVLPSVVVGVAFHALLTTGGPLGATGLDGTTTAVVAAMVFFNYGLVVRTVGTMWSRLDPRAVEAARARGAGPWRAWRTVTLPSLAPAIASAASLTFLFCATAYGVVLVLGGVGIGTIETEIYRLTTQYLDLRGAAVLSVVQLGVIALALWVAERARAATQTRLRLRTEVPAGRLRAADAPALVVTAVTVGGLLVAPMAVLVVRSLQRDGAWTLANYTDLGSTGGRSALLVTVWEAAANSGSVAVAAAAIALSLGVAVCLVVSRRPRSRALARVITGLDAAFMLPLGVSAVTVGFGLLITLARPPLALTRSGWILPLAQAVVAVPLVVRTLLPALRAVDPRQREAAAALGAGPGRVLATVDGPHLLRAGEQLPADVQVILCAGAPDTPEIKAEVEGLVARLRDKRTGVVWIEEMLPRPELIAVLAASDVFVCPSVYEPLGIVNLEAMAVGLPVVGSATGGIPDVIVDGETGLLVPIEQVQDGTGTPIDPARFEADLAERLITLVTDTEAARTMGQAARRRVEEHFAWEAIAQRTMDVYNWVLAQG